MFGSNSEKWREMESPETFVLFVASLAIFTEVFIYSVMVPVTPYALLNRVGIVPEEVQLYTSMFLAIYGPAQVIYCLIQG